jgi:2-keto-3-deoxy-L-rhamnonate aldolase RhmA
VDIIVVAPTDLSESLGLRGQPEKLAEVYQEISMCLQKIGKARLGVPFGHPVIPFGAKELKAMGVVYADLHPPIATRLLRSFRDDVMRIRSDLQE